MQSYDLIVDIPDPVMDERNAFQRRLDNANDRIHTATDRVNDASDRLQEQLHDSYENASQAIPLSKEWFRRNQRLGGYLVEAEAIPQENRTVIQKTAIATFGVFSPSSAVTYTGHGLAYMSLENYKQGNYTKAFGQYVVARFFDLGDGAVAKGLKIRSSFGAASDAGGDSLMMVKAVKTLAEEGDISLREAENLVHQRLATVGYNSGVRLYGGSPNPNSAAKMSLFLLSQRVGLKMAAKALHQLGHRKSLMTAGSKSEVVKITALRTSAVVVDGLSKAAGISGVHAGNLGIAEYREDYKVAKAAHTAKRLEAASQDLQ